MKIVVLDGYTLNPGDLSWEPLYALGETEIFERSNRPEAIDRAKDAEILLVNKVVIDADFLEKCPRLKFIAVSATGYNNLDIKALREKNILSSNVNNYGSHAVAQHSIALLLSLCNAIIPHHQAVKDGEWGKVQDFCMWKQSMTELYNKTIGIIGWGSIGSKVGAIAHAMGMNVIYWSRSSHTSTFAQQKENIDEVLSMADVISLHCFDTPETHHIIREENIDKMKTGVFIINTARGGLVNESDLKDALLSGKIAGAGLDVLSEEPPKNSNLLFGISNCIITPHNAWAPVETRNRLLQMTIENINAFINGSPQNLI